MKQVAMELTTEEVVTIYRCLRRAESMFLESSEEVNSIVNKIERMASNARKD